MRLPLHGAHHVANALAAAAVALQAGLSAAQVAAGLGRATPRSAGGWRSSSGPTGSRSSTTAYNANPDSVAAALDALAAMSAGRRSWAVLGEMLELGAASAEEHDRVGRLARRSGVARLVVVGEGARDIHLGALAEGAAEGEESVVVPDVPAAIELVEPALRPGDVVLVKASRGARLDRVAAALLSAGRGDGS